MKSILNKLKYALLPVVPVVAISGGLFSTGSDTRPVQAEPLHVTALNDGLCVSLASAFAGLPATVAKFNCENNMTQDSMRKLSQCIAQIADCENTSLPITRPTPELFVALDRDLNKIHAAQTYSIIAFVDDDFPVRFITDVGQFLTPLGTPAGKDLFCAVGSPQYPPALLDPDCDGDNTTEGDGVVVAKLRTELSDGKEGDVHVNVIQENIAFPVTLTRTGPPEKIVMSFLFGKDTIQTGATPSTPASQADCQFGTDPARCQEEDFTDCNFAASTDGVLGAYGQAEKTIIIARALDDNDVETVGALLTWYIQNDGFPPYPPGGDAAFGAETFGDPNVSTRNRLNQGGVALPQTPTIDLGGTLGVGFPQFVCGGRTPGDLTLDVNFDPILSPLSDPDEHEMITVNVIGPATDMTLVAEPAEIDCNGTNSSTVTAMVTNAEGDPVANGLDIRFSVLALGTVNPLKVDSADGKGSSTVVALAGAGNVTADGQPRGVTVTVSANGQIHPRRILPGDSPEAPRQTFDMVERSILVRCTGGPPPPGTGTGGAGGGGGAPGGGQIRPPDTGLGAGTPAGLSWWALAGLAGAGIALAGAATATRRR